MISVLQNAMIFHRLFFANLVLLISALLTAFPAEACEQFISALDREISSSVAALKSSPQEKRQTELNWRASSRANLQKQRDRLNLARTPEQIQRVGTEFEKWTEENNNDMSGLIEIDYVNCLVNQKIAALEATTRSSVTSPSSPSTRQDAPPVSQPKPAQPTPTPSTDRQHQANLEATDCVKPDFSGLYGSMQNTCNFKVHFTYCGFQPKEGSWLTTLNCEKQQFGADEIGPGRAAASHTKGVKSLHWFACKEPAWPLDTRFENGEIVGRCRTVGGR